MDRIEELFNKVNKHFKCEYLGNQLLIHGDCLDVMELMEDKSIDCFVSDVPYKIIAGGVRIVELGDEPSGIFNKRDYSKTDPKGCLNRGRKVVSDGSRIANKWLKKDSSSIPSAVKDGKMFKHNDIKFEEWLPIIFEKLKLQTHAYIMINGRNLKDLQQKSEDANFEYQNLLVWNKGNATPNKYYMQQLEFILMLSKRPARNINNMGSKNLFNIPNIIGNKIHPTEKPVSLMEQLIINSTNKNEIVCDLFAGSFTTTIACIRTGRKSICVEKDETYYKIGVERVKEELAQGNLFAQN